MEIQLKEAGNLPSRLFFSLYPLAKLIAYVCCNSQRSEIVSACFGRSRVRLAETRRWCSGKKELGVLEKAMRDEQQLHSAMISTINLHLVRMFQTLVSSDKKFNYFPPAPRTTSLSIRFD